MNNTTNEQLANRLMGQVQFNDALDETCRALMEAAANKLREKPAASTPVAHVLRIDTQQSALIGLYDDSLKPGDQLYARPQPAALAQDRTSQQEDSARLDLTGWYACEEDGHVVAFTKDTSYRTVHYWSTEGRRIIALASADVA